MVRRSNGDDVKAELLPEWKTVGDYEPRGGHFLFRRSPDTLNCRCVAVELIDNKWLYGLIAVYVLGFIISLYLRYWVFI